MEGSSIIDAFFSKHAAKLTDTSIELIRPCLQILELPKKHVLVKEGHTNGLIYLLIKGAARSYYLKNGKEVHTWFAFEDDVVGSLRNYNDMPSRETIELLEDSILLGFNIQLIKPLMVGHVEISSMVIKALEDYTLYLEDKLYYTQLRTARERYDALLKYEPKTLQRVPLTYIASYLGISRETLSRLRAGQFL